ncbi:MAG: hypothetical protein ACNA8R_03810 [Nitriliruptoraceae bacterium]
MAHDERWDTRTAHAEGATPIAARRGADAVWPLGTLGTDALAGGAALTIVEGALPVFSFARALTVAVGRFPRPGLAPRAAGADQYPLNTPDIATRILP